MEGFYHLTELSEHNSSFIVGRTRSTRESPDSLSECWARWPTRPKCNWQVSVPFLFPRVMLWPICFSSSSNRWSAPRTERDDNPQYRQSFGFPCLVEGTRCSFILGSYGSFTCRWQLNMCFSGFALAKSTFGIHTSLCSKFSQRSELSSTHAALAQNGLLYIFNDERFNRYWPVYDNDFAVQVRLASLVNATLSIWRVSVLWSGPRSLSVTKQIGALLVGIMQTAASLSMAIPKLRDLSSFVSSCWTITTWSSLLHRARCPGYPSLPHGSTLRNCSRVSTLFFYMEPLDDPYVDFSFCCT